MAVWRNLVCPHTVLEGLEHQRAEVQRAALHVREDLPVAPLQQHHRAEVRDAPVLRECGGPAVKGHTQKMCARTLDTVPDQKESVHCFLRVKFLKKKRVS